MAMGVRGSILFGIVITAVIGMLMGIGQKPAGIVQLPRFADWAPVFGKLDILGALRLGFFEIVFAFLFVDLFDTVGTLIGVSKQGVSWTRTAGSPGPRRRCWPTRSAPWAVPSSARPP